MNRIVTTTIFTLIIIILYRFIDINLFTIDLPRRVRSELYKGLRVDPELDTSILIVDIGYIGLDTVKEKLEILESLEPKSIGVNLCNIEEKSEILDYYLGHNERIITCDCSPDSDKRTSRITSARNEVTHFLSDKDSYFELQLVDNLAELRRRRNNKERINFRAENRYFQVPLADIEFIPTNLIKDKVIIIGFLYDSLVTPINEWYGRPGIIHGDMSDVQISANIISTINGNEFVDDVNPILRIVIILAISLICTGLLRLMRTKRDMLNVILATLTFIILNGLCTALIVIAFAKNYYLNLDELTVVLLISAIVSVYWNTRSNKAPLRNKNNYSE